MRCGHLSYSIDEMMKRPRQRAVKRALTVRSAITYVDGGASARRRST
jgi:hypothetical protein